jgi:hypothetical protein
MGAVGGSPGVGFGEYRRQRGINGIMVKNNLADRLIMQYLTKDNRNQL